jgi:tRNA-dihydrouridine synthase
MSMYLNQKKSAFKILLDNILLKYGVTATNQADYKKLLSIVDLPEDWNKIENAWLELEQINDDVILIANGDILNAKIGEKIVKESGFDGYMIGRGVFQNMWAFDTDSEFDSKTGALTVGGKIIGLKERLELLENHLVLWKNEWPDNQKNYPVLKKYFKIYLSGFEGAVAIRITFMETKNIEEAMILLEKYKVEYAEKN